MPKESQPKKIAIAIEMHYPFPWHLDISQGIMRYGEEHGWTCVIDPYLLSLQMAQNAGFDGVIGRLNKEVYRALEGRNLPAVNVMGSNFIEYLDEVPSLKLDMADMMRKAIDHLVVCGYRRYGYLGVSRLSGNDKKLEFIAEVLAGYGYPPPASIAVPDDFETKRETTLELAEQLTQWLKELEKPVGILVQDPIVSTLLIPLCKELGLRVPEDVGIVGLFADDATSLASSPTLTYINSDFFEHGYQAAALLDELMSGKEVHPRHRLYTPERVVVRESSDVFICDDALVSRAVRYIAGRVRQNPTIDEVADHLEVSRRTLERRFSDSLGRTIQTEIKRLRIDYIKRLVLETGRPLSDIARDFGFSSTSYFAKYFKDELGVTPSEYRKQYAKRSSSK